MKYLVENSVAQKIDGYFNAHPVDSGLYWRFKAPWNKSSRYIEAKKYFKIRYEIATLIEGLSS